jgi:uncharacterized protein YraI
MQSVRAFLVASALGLSATAALASPALVTSDLNLRSGPGTQYRSLGVVPGGSTVNVFECQRGWCAVSAFGRNGFVNDNYLDFGGPMRGYGPPPPPSPPVVYERPVYGPPVYMPPPPPYYRPYHRRYYW